MIILIARPGYKEIIIELDYSRNLLFSRTLFHVDFLYQWPVYLFPCDLIN